MKGNSLLVIKSALVQILLLTCCCRNEKGTQSLQFYYRDIGDNNGDTTYHDYLIFTNYKKGSFTLKELANIAGNYVDTVKADRTVSGITFVGKENCTTLPKGEWDTFDQQKKFFIANIAFIEKRRVGYISIWKNSESIDFTVQKEIDSLIALKEKL